MVNLNSHDTLYEQVLEILADMVIGYCYEKMQAKNVEADLDEAA